MRARVTGTLGARNRHAGAAMTVLVLLSTATVAFADEKGSSPVEGFHRAFSAQRPDPSQSARVQNVLIVRDAGRFELQEGSLILATPVQDRVRSAVFIGRGVFVFEPPDPIEQNEVERHYKSRTLRVPFESLVLVFADSTLVELQRQLSFFPRAVPDLAAPRLRKALSFVRVEKTGWLDPGMAQPMLDGRDNGYLFACVQGRGPHAVMLEIDPLVSEEVVLWRELNRHAGANETTPRELVSSCGLAGGRPVDDQIKLDVRARHVRVDGRITEAGDFSTEVELTCPATDSISGWRAFGLFSRFTVDSAAWEDGRPAEFYKGADSPQLWVRFTPPGSGGAERRLRLWYRGRLFEREGGWFVLPTSSGWLPRRGRTYSTFDLTFRTPHRLRFVCVGDSIATERDGAEVVSRWKVSTATRNVSFNLGYFKEHRVHVQDLPPVTVLMVQDVHDQLARELLEEGQLSGRAMERQVAADIVNSLAFFHSVFGPLSVRSIVANEIPFGHGEAFRGFVHLSWATFQRTLANGEDEIFRAHEVAHQWWGIGVDFATYHDQWLSEGFAHFSALWYLQQTRKDNQRYLDVLKEWRKQILTEHHFLVGQQRPPGPIWLGYRAATEETPGDYQKMVYRKGAWVLHMLRNLLIDLDTSREDRFVALMREFFATYSGTTATTEDFRALAEKYAGEDLGWFFDQWVYGTQVPIYGFSYDTQRTADGQYRVKCRVEQKEVGERFRMYVPIRVDLDGDRFTRLRVLVEGPRTEFELPLLPVPPKNVVFNDLESVLCEVQRTRRSGVAGRAAP